MNTNHTLPARTTPASARCAESRFDVTVLSHDSAAFRAAIPGSLAGDGGRVRGLMLQRYSVPFSGELMERAVLLVGVPAGIGLDRIARRLELLGNALGCDTEVTPHRAA